MSICASFTFPNVFNCNVFILKETANSASLGAAYIAKYGMMNCPTSC